MRRNRFLQKNPVLLVIFDEIDIFFRLSASDLIPKVIYAQRVRIRFCDRSIERWDFP